MPIFRSRMQADLLAWLFLHPDREYTLTELAERLGVVASTVHDEAARLIAAGILLSRKVGRERMLRANQSGPVAEALSRLLLVTFGPKIVVEEEFAPVDNVASRLIYGSWAARYDGKPGPAPADIDILVVGHPDRAEVYAAADRAQARLDLPVNPTLRTPQHWNDDSDALVVAIKNDSVMELGVPLEAV